MAPGVIKVVAPGKYVLLYLSWPRAAGPQVCQEDDELPHRLTRNERVLRTDLAIVVDRRRSSTALYRLNENRAVFSKDVEKMWFSDKVIN